MSEGNKKFCTNCGSEVSNEAKFCMNCGNKLEIPVVETVNKEALSENSETVEAVETIENTTPVEEAEIDIHYEDEPVNSGVYSNPQYYETETIAQEESGGSIGFSIASMVCGILSLLCCCFDEIGLILGIAAIVLGVITLREEHDGNGMAIAGITTGAIGLIIAIGFLIIGGLAFWDVSDIFE